MKANATKTVPLGGAFWDAGAQVFINKGVNRRWRDLLTAADVGAYQSRARQELGAECAHWLESGDINPKASWLSGSRNILWLPSEPDCATKWDPARMVEMIGARRLTGTAPCRARWAAATETT